MCYQWKMFEMFYLSIDVDFCSWIIKWNMIDREIPSEEHPNLTKHSLITEQTDNATKNTDTNTVITH